jgi:hypothetical protein
MPIKVQKKRANKTRRQSNSQPRQRRDRGAINKPAARIGKNAFLDRHALLPSATTPQRF